MKHLIRRLIASFAARQGYAVSGNLIFPVADLTKIQAGAYRFSVSERPAKHSARMVRAAELLADTYTPGCASRK